ncbi:hypothetical protein ACSAZL_12510 [Methanosarcina sp. T3]|uniref:hypothetical protein n=1 Tax=Methanosarcina sp. T3 TaxID=3439062 RepID=UPI003F86449E
MVKRRKLCPNGCYSSSSRYLHTAYIQKRITTSYGIPGQIKNIPVGFVCDICGYFEFVKPEKSKK